MFWWWYGKNSESGTLPSENKAEENTDFNWVEYFTDEHIGLAVVKTLGESNFDEKIFLKFSFDKTDVEIGFFNSVRANFNK